MGLLKNPYSHYTNAANMSIQIIKKCIKTIMLNRLIINYSKRSIINHAHCRYRMKWERIVNSSNHIIVFQCFFVFFYRLEMAHAYCTIYAFIVYKNCLIALLSKDLAPN